MEEAGGWEALQTLLRSLRSVADRASDRASSEVGEVGEVGSVSIAQVALAWVLSRRCVAAAIVGARGVGRCSLDFP